MIQINLPPPISTNNLYANVRGKGRVKSQRYNTWEWHATAALQPQKPLPKPNGPVRILYLVGEVGVSPIIDGDNCLKCLTDTLVKHGVIPDDNRATVRAIGMEWIKGKEGVTACISEVPVSIPFEGVIS